MLAHNVYFTLEDPTPAKIDELVAACHKYLKDPKDHPGLVFFAAGTVVNELARPVNDRMFHVALHVVFQDKHSHDLYQVAPSHLKFIELHKPSWRNVRVFDSYVS